MMALRNPLYIFFLLCFLSNNANAHVKWFAEYDLICPPRSPYQIVFGEYFLAFCLVVGPLMFAVAYIDLRLAEGRSWISRQANAASDVVQPYVSSSLRLGVSAFFVAAVSYGGFILTPELKTEADWVPVLQVAIAALALLPKAAFLAGAGMFVLYGYAVTQFGLYHLLDYPIFLGIAAYLIITSLLGEERAILAQNVMRWCTGITLMWAGIEKFAFPEWSFGLLHAQPELTFGFSADFYMVSAGFVEFCCAFLLITGMLSARASAFVLQFFFVSAIYYFGLIDAIGHSGIIVVLTILILSRNPVASQFRYGSDARTAAAHTGLFFISLAVFIILYCEGHYLAYRSYLNADVCGV